MIAKQLSIFLENKEGRLTQVAEVLAQENINFSAWSIAETTEFGILRSIVSEPERALQILKDHHFAASLTSVIGIRCPNVPGALAKVLRLLSDNGVFIEYMYSFANNGSASIIIRPTDLEKCQQILGEKGIEQLAAESLYAWR